MSKSILRPPFRPPQVPAAVRSSRLSCGKVGKAQIFTSARESSGESRKRRCKAQYWSHWDDSRSCPLALLISSAKSSYDASNTQIKQITSNIIFLDILLEQYGPEAHDLRVALRDAVPPTVDRIWNERANGNKSEPFVATAEAVAFIKKVQELKPDNAAKRDLQVRMLNVITDLQQLRFALFAQAHDSISMPFLVILIFWLTIIFAREHVILGRTKSWQLLRSDGHLGRVRGWPTRCCYTPDSVSAMSRACVGRIFPRGA
jgi:hypothetical protein